LSLRMALVPITNFASQAVTWILLLGIFMNFAKVVWPAIIVFAILTLFQLVTLPVEYDASRRAKEQLVRLGLVSGGEQRAVGKVLNAAALTYVAALVAALFDLLHFILIARNQRT
jgi:Zn-dependent membrane protease YugP